MYSTPEMVLGVADAVTCGTGAADDIGVEGAAGAACPLVCCADAGAGCGGGGSAIALDGLFAGAGRMAGAGRSTRFFSMTGFFAAGLGFGVADAGVFCFSGEGGVIKLAITSRGAACGCG